MKLTSHSAPFINKLNEDELINIINSSEKYCAATVARARRSITTIYPNYVGILHKLK